MRGYDACEACGGGHARSTSAAGHVRVWRLVAAGVAALRDVFSGGERARHGDPFACDQRRGGVLRPATQGRKTVPVGVQVGVRVGAQACRRGPRGSAREPSAAERVQAKLVHAEHAQMQFAAHGARPHRATTARPIETPIISEPIRRRQLKPHPMLSAATPSQSRHARRLITVRHHEISRQASKRQGRETCAAETLCRGDPRQETCDELRCRWKV